MRVSVVMATYDKREYLRYTLASLTIQTHRDFEVVICDDGTDGGIEDVIAAYADRMEIVHLAQANGGRSAARNAALAAATGDLIIFSDDDRIASPGFIAAHVAASYAATSGTIGWKRRAVTLWQPRVLPVDEADLITIAERFGGSTEPLTRELRVVEPEEIASAYADAVERIDLGDEPDNYHAIVEKYSDELTGFHFGWALATTANLSVRREILVDVGFFDTGFRGWGVEDTDVSYRLWKAGVRFRVDRAAVNHHQIHPIGTGNALLNNRVRRATLMVNIDYFCEKHRSLEAYLFKQRWEHVMTLDEANVLLSSVREATSSCIADELVRLYAAV